MRGILVGVVAALLVLAAAPAAAHAQIVNVQSLVGQETPEGLSAALDGTFDWRTGNTDLLVLSGATTVRYRHEDHLVFAIARGAYGREAGETIIANLFEHLRYRFTVGPRLTAEAFAQHEVDRFRRLQARALVGAGPRITLVQDPRAGLVLGVAYLYEREELDDKAGTSDAGRGTGTHRASTYLLFTSALEDKVTFVQTLYFQPALADPADFRLLNETQLQVKIGTRLTFKTAFVLAHDASPPETVEKTDTALQTGISLRFQ